MKHIFFAMLISAGLFSCNDASDSQENQTGDTTMTDATGGSDHSTTQTPQGIDTTNMTFKSAMQMNMDQMKGMQSTGNADNDFAALMKAHHTGGLLMAQLELGRGTDEQMKQMARKMIEDQQKDIAELDRFASGHAPHGGGSESFYNTVMNHMKNMQLDVDQSVSADKQFVQAMIKHHQGGIDMATAYLRSDGHAEQLKTLANNMIGKHQKEVQEMQAWLQKNGGQ
jgi:uncharacterized protein (DUF305 family)